jgi:replicative DNA helicase
MSDAYQPYRSPPHSLDAEQALLGAILVNNGAMDRVSGFLDAEHFHDHLHRAIFETAAKLIADGKRADPITLKPFFENAEPINSTPVSVYLGLIAANATTIINAADYARTIRDLAMRRQLILIGEDIVNAAYDSSVDFPPNEQIEEAETRLFKLVEHGVGDRGSASARTVLVERMASIDAARKNPGANSGVTTGLRDLDAQLDGGMQPSDLAIAAGATSMGKTSLGIGVVMASPVPVAFFTLEMSKAQMVDRMISAASGIPAGKLRSGRVNDAEWTRICEAEASINRRLVERDIIIDDTGGLSIAQLSARARRMKRQHGIGLLVVDYLQLMRGSRRDSRVLEVGEISSGLKAVAKELDIPVLALAQLNREVDKRPGNRPHLADLRESGSIEQDADTIMFVYRESYYVERDKPAAPTRGDKDAEAKFKSWELRLAACANKAEVTVAKARHGRIGSVDMHFDAATTRFSDLARHDYGDIEHPKRSWPYE